MSGKVSHSTGLLLVIVVNSCRSNYWQTVIVLHFPLLCVVGENYRELPIFDIVWPSRMTFLASTIKSFQPALLKWKWLRAINDVFLQLTESGIGMLFVSDDGTNCSHCIIKHNCNFVKDNRETLLLEENNDDYQHYNVHWTLFFFDQICNFFATHDTAS